MVAKRLHKSYGKLKHEFALFHVGAKTELFL